MAALCFAVALQAKQGILPIAILTLCSEWQQPRRLALGLGSLFVFCAGPVLWLRHATDGWYWTYVFQVAPGFKVGYRTMLFYLPREVAPGLLLALLLIVAAAVLTPPRKLDRTVSFCLLTGAGMVLYTRYVRAHAGAAGNADLPAFLWIALAAGVSFARLYRRFSDDRENGALIVLLAVPLLQLFVHLYGPAYWVPKAQVLVRQTTLLITVKDDDAAFQWVKEWFLDQQFVKRVRRLDLDTTLQGEALSLIPAPGTHCFWCRGRLFRITFTRSEDTKGRSQRRTESLTFETLGRNQALLRQLVDDIVASHRKRDDLASALYLFDDYWNRVQAYAPRLLDSIILKPGEKEFLIQDLQRFRATRARYRQLGVPYHRGYLFYGSPGTGKTSLVSALAAAFGMSIYAMNLTEMNDRTMKNAMTEVPENSIILFEDIDCMRAGHRRREKGEVRADEGASTGNASPGAAGVTLSGLLNVLDGFHAPENVVFIMTTNHAETLDPALLRPGRIDYKLYLGEVADIQKASLYRRFFPGASELEARQFAERHEVRTMAEFQGLLLRLEGDPHTEDSDPACIRNVTHTI